MMELYKTLTTVILLLALSVAPVTRAAEQATTEPATVEQQQIDDWAKKGLARFDSGDMIEAIQNLEKAAKLGHSEAQAMLGYIYHQGSESEMALPWFEKAVAQGNVFAMSELSVFYDQGIAVKKDPVKAMELLQQAADGDYVPAINALAAAYEKGTPPLTVNFELALKYYRLAADKLYLGAIVRLQHAQELGELGMTADPEKAKAMELHYKALQEAHKIRVVQAAAKAQQIKEQEAAAKAQLLKEQEQQTKQLSPAKVSNDE